MLYFEPPSISAGYCDGIWRYLFAVCVPLHLSLCLFLISSILWHPFLRSDLSLLSMLFLLSFLSSSQSLTPFLSQANSQVSWLDFRRKLLQVYQYDYVPPSSLYDKIFQRLKDFIGEAKEEAKREEHREYDDKLSTLFLLS